MEQGQARRQDLPAEGPGADDAKAPDEVPPEAPQSLPASVEQGGKAPAQDTGSNPGSISPAEDGNSASGEATSHAPADLKPGDVEAWAMESLQRLQDKAKATTGEEPAEPVSSVHGYHEWHLRRLQRKLRLLTWTVAALVALLAVGGGYLLATLELGSTPVDQPSTSDSAGAQIQELENRLRSVEEARASDETALESISVSVDRMRSAIERLDRRQSGAMRCINRSLADFDEALRDLLTRRMSPDAFLRRPPLARCGA